MGTYLNPRNKAYEELTNSRVFVDKSLLIEYTNQVMDTSNKNICVSRPRRFGKSSDANMLVAYYSKGCDSHELFDDLKISQTEDYLAHLNQSNVIHLNMQSFLSLNHSMDEMLADITDSLALELLSVYAEVEMPSKKHLSRILDNIFAVTNETFIFVIDEWDCVFREYKNDTEAQKEYLDFLRNLLKDKNYVSLAYMTGILPIKKYGTHSALNMFEEISMIDPGLIPESMGFTEAEVHDLCQMYDVDFKEMKQWYDGYHLTDTISTFSPRSVVMAVTRKQFGNYWTSTETYEALQIYIDMNLDGLRDDIIKLLAGENVPVQTTSFQNDMTTFKSKDDVLTLLVHLGYLGYSQKRDGGYVYIPNKEVTDSFINSIRNSDWQETTKALMNSRDLLEATWQMDQEKVAKYIQEAHLDTSILTYNDENALSYTICVAYIIAKNDYTMIRELPTGKGFADIVFIPRYDQPAMIVELKWDQTAKTAIQQIKEKKYPKALEKYKDNLLLVGINYDKETKEHTCKIEKCSHEVRD